MDIYPKQLFVRSPGLPDGPVKFVRVDPHKYGSNLTCNKFSEVDNEYPVWACFGSRSQAGIDSICYNSAMNGFRMYRFSDDGKELRIGILKKRIVGHYGHYIISDKETDKRDR